MALKLDLHIHTHYSSDSWLSLKALINNIKSKGLSGVAVTDHNTMRGAFKLKNLNPPFKLILAEEVKSKSGDIIGYFLQKEIPKGLCAEETIKRIKAQGGLVAIPHPFDLLRSCRMKIEKLHQIIDQIDLIEVRNSRTLWPGATLRSIKFAREHLKPQIAGSDCHSRFELGQAYTEIEDFKDSQDFLIKARQAKIHLRSHYPFWLYPLSGLAKLKHYIWPVKN